MSSDAVAKRMKLGDKILAANAPSDVALGATYMLQDIDRVARAFVPKSGASVEVRMVKNAGGGAISPGQRLKAVSSPISVAASAAGTDVIVGYADPWISGTIAVGDVFLMIIEGPTKVLSGGAFAAGAVLGGDASGKSTTGGTAGLTAPARAIDLAGGADVLARAYVNCRAAF